MRSSASPVVADPATASRRSARDWLVDLSCIGAVVVLGVFFALEGPEMGANTGVLLTLDVAAGLLSGIALWWRRQWPTELGLVIAVTSAFSQVAGFAALVMLFTVAVHRSTRTLTLVASVNLVATVAIVVQQPDPTSSPATDLALSVMMLIAVIAWGMFVRARRLLVRSLSERAERAEAEQQWRFGQGRQLERTRIAREMHDVLGHRISLISMHAGALELRTQSADTEVAESAAIIRASAHQALQDLREVIGVLRTDPEEDAESDRPQPTLEDVPALVEESRRAGMNILLEYQVAETEDGAPASVGRTAYRVVQEGLTNARKHAPGAAVLVQVNGTPGPGLSVELLSRKPIRPATGTEPDSSGQGLLGLAERADLVGGRVEHHRTPDGDFLLQCWLPWSAWRIPERRLPYV